MRFTLTIDCDNDAFAEAGTAAEVARILAETADKLRQWPAVTVASFGQGFLYDANGNRVGFCGFERGAS